MTTGVNCTVLIDGVRLQDGSPGDNLADPVALDDLVVTWGRDDTMSQPEVDSCTFKVMDAVDEGGGGGLRAFLTAIRTGSRVDVLARGDVSPVPSADTFTNPGFETTAVTWSATNGVAARTTRRVWGGSNSLVLTPTNPASPASVLLAPAPFSAPGTAPDAWDSIPTTTAGQSWKATVHAWVPAGATASVRAVTFSGPYLASATPIGISAAVAGDGTWQTITTETVVPSDDKWVGLQVTLDPTGPAWDDLPSALTWDAVDPSWAWDDMGSLYLDDVQVSTPSEGVERGVLVFAGRITSLSAGWDASADAPVIDVVANGFTADLENRSVGDEPWPIEDVEARSTRILTLVGLPITIDVDTSLADYLVSWRDVDSQGAAGLLKELAASVDGVLWPAVHQTVGAYLRLEDPAMRASLLMLVENGGTITIVQTNPDEGFDLSACLIERDPVTWVQDVSDVVTRVAVSWKEQGVDDEGNPTTTDVTERVVDTGLEAQHGTRAVSLSSQLQAAPDAVRVAEQILGRTSPDAWRAEGLTVDDDDVYGTPDGVALVLDLLDGTSRIGAPIVIGDMPEWAPSGTDASVYLEGGSYRFVGGRWVLDLLVSASTGVGESAAWDELDPDWTWDQWAPDITWDDLRGVAAPSGG